MEVMKKAELFKKILRFIDENLEDAVEKELLDLFCAIVSATFETDKPSPLISSTSLKFLEKSLWINPSLVHWTIDQLLCFWSKSFTATDSLLQDIYETVLKEILNASSISSIDESIKSNINNVDEKNLRILLSILSKLNLTDEKNNNLSQWLNPMLLKSCNFQDIELTFYSRKDPNYYKTWHKFLDDILSRNKQPNNIDNSLKIIDSIFEINEGILRSTANEIFIRTINNKINFLSDIINLCYTLTINNRLDLVSKILNNEFKTIWLLILLKYLKDSPEIITNNLELLLKNSQLNNYCILNRMNEILNNQLNVLNWISKNSPKKSLRITLNQLKKSSTLSVLKSSINLHDCNIEIFNLLKHSDYSMTIFRSYYVMLNALHGILLCNNYNCEFEKISDYFSEMEKYLNNFKPIRVRIELIENIFSIMFMRWDYFETDNASDCGDDDDETIKQRQKNHDKFSESEFVCNKYSIREAVHYLNRSIFVITNDLSILKNQTDDFDEFDDIQKRVGIMRKYLAETAWRLELLTSQEFIKKQGLPDNDVQVLINNVINPPRGGGNFYRASESSSDENNTRSDLDLSSESGSAGNPSNNGGKRRRRLLNACSIGDYGGGRSTLNDMLASMDTLVLRCLWKGDYHEAQRVIEKLGMGNSRLAGEIIFSRAIKTFRHDVVKQKTVETEINNKSNSKDSTIDIIRQAVKDGLQASRTASHLETFLASQEPNILFLSNNSTNLKYLMTLTALDLTLTSSQDYPTSENLTEVTNKHFEFTEKLKNTRYYDLFQTIHLLLHERKGKTSVMKIITDATLPLSLKEYKKKLQYWTELEDSLLPLEDKTEFIDKIPGDNLKSEFTNLLTTCNNGDPYLHNIHIHLNILMTISPKPNESAQLQVNASILRNSLDFYIGYQIFDLNVNLQCLEKIAEDLQINLVYSIIINCCPKLLNYDPIEVRKAPNKWGIIVLNRFEESFHSSEISLDPNSCVIQILSELLSTIRETNPDVVSLKRCELNELSKSQKIREILKKTKNLSFVDLSHLSFGNHTLSFFLNLWNLLFLHSAIDVWSQDPPFNDLRHTITLKTIGYEVGDLGLVSISSLRSKLLGFIASDYSFHFGRVEELNEPAWQDLDLQQDPRSIFAMINEYNNSPVVNIYHPETLSDNLNAAVHQYLDFYKDPEDETRITLSDIFKSVKEFLSDNFFTQEDFIRFESLNYCYEINLRYQKSERSKFERSDSRINDVWKSRKVSGNLLQYLEGHCWLLCYLVQRIHDEKSLENRASNRRTAVLENLLNSVSTQRLQILYENNKVLAGLQHYLPIPQLWEVLQTLLLHKNFRESLELINNLPDSFIQKNVEMQRLRDKNLCEIIGNLDENNSRIIENLYQIQDEQMLTQLILLKVKVWPVRICEEALIHVLSHSESGKLPGHCKSELNEILCRVMVFDKMLPYFRNQLEETELNWCNVVYRTEKTDPIKIVKSLIDAQQFELCLEWLEYQTTSSEIHSLVSKDLFLGLLNNRNDFKQARKLLSALPIGQSEKLCKGVIPKLVSIESLKFIVSYLENSSEREKYRRASLGVELLEKLDSKDRSNYIHLITEPFLLLEQLLMNCKFDNLQRILKTSSEKLKDYGFTIDRFDRIVRFYAKKSLDLRVAVQRDLTESSRSKDSSTSQDFIMPINPPTRDEWIPNDKSRECSCCRNVTFSMFNRRHHCRRCGRVVCGSCSNQRMRVSGYANSVLVRVCDDCKKQSSQQQTQSSTASSEAFDSWELTNDETHNKTLREEFCFEYAPNISLCLAILNLHSDHEAYANFLQDRCDEMKRLLHPDSKGQINREIDHKLIIRMIKSLLIAAKVKCAKLGLNTGLAHCDRFLSQIDLIDTLVKSDCLSLLPRDDFNEHTFRRLRDLLTEKEQWILALDVSTKSGLDTQGVWAAWGKACLKVGYYERARDKFVHCLEKVNQEDFEGWVLLPSPTPKVSRGEAKSVKNRPAKDPPLVTEILQILEGSNSSEQYSKNQFPKNSSAQEIMDALGNLKKISHGQYAIPKLSSNVKNIRYQESLYYLLMYGSFNSILEFFIRHNELEKCLSYSLENDIDQEIFFNVSIIGCLKTGKLMKLCETMKQNDASLLIWKKYLIATCLYLERKQLMNTLYQLQLFMKDYIRAAMTCIKFYVTDASNYVDLCARTNYLIDAQRHFESELQFENFGKSRRKSVSSNLSGSGALTMEMEPAEIDKHINTISRQMEIAKFLGNCEKEGRNVGDYLSKLSFMESEGLHPRSVPTLFGNQKERTHLSALAILCGRDVEEGFGFAFRIMQDYHLSPQKIYSLVGHILALDKRISSIEQLVKCCVSSGASNSNVIADRILAHCVKLLIDKGKSEPGINPREQIDPLIRIINDVELKIDSYIESKQLKAAYLLAVKHSRSQDIKKILKEADRLGQNAIKSICTKWLQQAKK